MEPVLPLSPSSSSTLSSSYLSASSSSSSYRDDSYLPLWLSLLAGLSTCLGAAVVWVAQASSRPLGHAHLAFALALAGSVMITVSCTSLLPESFAHDSGQFLSWTTMVFWERTSSWCLGCLLYVLLSKYGFPEPDAILGFEATTIDSKEGKGDEDDNGRLEMARLLSSWSMDDDNDPITHAPPDQSTSLPTLHASLSWSEESASLPSSSPSLTRKRSLVAETMSSLQHHATPPPTHRAKTPFATRLESAATEAPEPDKKGRAHYYRASFRRWSSGMDLTTSEAQRAWRVAMLLLVSLAVHNFPEGLAVAASTLHSTHLGWTTTVAIALHNIPEGVAIAVPMLAARPDSPWLAFGLASLSGLAEPLGAAVAMVWLQRPASSKLSTPQVDISSGQAQTLPSSPSWSWASSLWDMKNVLAFVAGIMMAVAALELFPEARRHAQAVKWPLWAGTLTGVVVMLASDAYLES